VDQIAILRVYPEGGFRVKVVVVIGGPIDTGHEGIHSSSLTLQLAVRGDRRRCDPVPRTIQPKGTGIRRSATPHSARNRIARRIANYANPIVVPVKGPVI